MIDDAVLLMLMSKMNLDYGSDDLINVSPASNGLLENQYVIENLFHVDIICCKMTVLGLPV